MEEIEYRFNNPFTPHKLFPTQRNQKWKAGLEIVHRWADDAIEKAKREDGHALVNVLLNAKSEDGEMLSLQQIHDECVTFLLAGHETSATCLAWAFYLLSTHPNIQEKACKEVDEIFGDRDGKEVTGEDLEK